MSLESKLKKLDEYADNTKIGKFIDNIDKYLEDTKINKTLDAFFRHKKVLYISAVAATIAAAADIYLTTSTITNISQEINPIARGLINEAGASGLIALKIPVLSACIYGSKKLNNSIYLTLPIMQYTLGAFSGPIIENLYNFMNQG